MRRTLPALNDEALETRKATNLGDTAEAALAESTRTKRFEQLRFLRSEGCLQRELTEAALIMVAARGA